MLLLKKHFKMIPDFQSFMRPVLEFSAAHDSFKLREIYPVLADQFNLTDSERKEMLPSGKQQTYKNRIGWAKTYLYKAGLLKRIKRGEFRISNEGQKLLKHHTGKITIAILSQYEGMQEFQSKDQGTTNEDAAVEVEKSITPEEAIEAAFKELNDKLAKELLETLKAVDPIYFEQIVVDLLVKMGYGGGLSDRAEVTQATNDEGIDGIINEDPLGLDTIYIQAKRWNDKVSRPKVQEFLGALAGKRAKKGVIITTSDFTKTARDAVLNIDSKVTLINGIDLARYMIKYN